MEVETVPLEHDFRNLKVPQGGSCSMSHVHPFLSQKNSKQIIIQTSCQGTHSTICQNSHLQFLSHLNSIFFHMYFGASIFTAQFLGQVLLQVFGCHESPRPIRLAQVQLHKKAKGHDTSHHTCVERRLEAGVLDLCGLKNSSKTSPLRKYIKHQKYIGNG